MSALVFKYRGLLWGIFAAAIFVFPASFDIARTAVAIPLLVIGQALRFWAAGIIPKYRTLTVDAPILITTGPYSITRNPLYLGNGIMGCGWAVALGWAWVPAFAAAFALIYSMIIIPYEEGFLSKKFGDAYARYKASTPQLIPSPKKYRPSSEIAFDGRRAYNMEKHSMRMNIVVTAAVIARLYFL